MQSTMTIQPRMTHVATLVPEAVRAIYALTKSAKQGGLPETTAMMVHLRASPTINVWNRLNVATRTPAGAWG